MDIAMLVLSIISTLTAVGSFIVALCVKKETKDIKEIKNSLSVDNSKSGNLTEITNNSGVIADKVTGGVTIHDKK